MFCVYDAGIGRKAQAKRALSLPWSLIVDAPPIYFSFAEEVVIYGLIATHHLCSVLFSMKVRHMWFGLHL